MFVDFQSGNKREFLRIALYVSLGLLCVSWFMKEKLPGKKDILDEIYQEPLQVEVDEEPFKTIIKGVSYTIWPLYEYELYGLVVSCHDTAAWWDYYHKQWGDSLNTKDVCVIWGDNIEQEVYPRMKFTSGSWTCTVSVDSRTAKSDWAKFNMGCLSNNHLLSDDSKIKKILRSVHRGDQIHLKGYLSNYSHTRGTFKRGTSTSRADQGSGACETIFLTGFEVLKRGNPVWWFLYGLSKFLVAGLFIYLFFLRLRDPFS